MGCRSAEHSAPIQSSVLKQEMINLYLESPPGDSPPAAVTRTKAVQDVDAGIAKIREHAPDFLMVTRATENKLKAGQGVPGSAERIAQAEGFLEEFQIPYPSLVVRLLEQYKAGELDPVRTELLAQLMVGAMKNTVHALTN